ncbi:hypothetical protein D3C71_2209070 [compost metagenome]
MLRAYLDNVRMFPGSLCGHDGFLLDLSVSDADRKSAIGADQVILLGKRTEIPLFARSPLILGSNEGYNGS